MGYLADIAAALAFMGLGYWLAYLRWQQYLPRRGRTARYSARLHQLPDDAATGIPESWLVEQPERLRRR